MGQFFHHWHYIMIKEKNERKEREKQRRKEVEENRTEKSKRIANDCINIGESVVSCVYRIMDFTIYFEKSSIQVLHSDD